MVDRVRLRELRAAAWHRQGGLCFYCCWPVTLAQVTLEHRVARANNGRTYCPTNIAASCYTCNQRKMRMSEDEFLLSDGYIRILIGRGLFVAFDYGTVRKKTTNAARRRRARRRRRRRAMMQKADQALFSGKFPQ